MNRLDKQSDSSFAQESNKWFAFLGITLLSFGSYLDYTIVNIALPTIQQELHTSLTSLQWVMNIYFLTLCILATIMGGFGDRFGRRRCFYAGTLIFAVASLMAGFSPNIHWLIFARFLQGAGSAIVFPLGPSLLPQSFPKNERPKAIAWLGSMGGIALALGPVLGGVIVTYLGWRWIFFINIPVLLVGYLFCLGSVKESAIVRSNLNLDWKGMLLLAFTMGGLVLSLIRSQSFGWHNMLTLFLLAIGICAGFLLIIVEKRETSPLINIDDFTNLLFCAGSILSFLAGALSSVALFFDPLYLQIIREQSPQLSGLVLFAIPLAVFTVAFTVGSMMTQLGMLKTILLGLGVAAFSSFLQIFFSVTTPLWYIVLAFLCLGSMWALGNTAPIIAAHAVVGRERTSVATGTMVTMFNIGGSIALAVAVVIYHLISNQVLSRIIQLNSNLTSSSLFILKQLITNPADSLQYPMDLGLKSDFHAIFMQAFTGVMWFLVILSALMLLIILLWKKSIRDIYDA